MSFWNFDIVLPFTFTHFRMTGNWFFAFCLRDCSVATRRRKYLQKLVRGLCVRGVFTRMAGLVPIFFVRSMLLRVRHFATRGGTRFLFLLFIQMFNPAWWRCVTCKDDHAVCRLGSSTQLALVILRVNAPLPRL